MPVVSMFWVFLGTKLAFESEMSVVRGENPPLFKGKQAETGCKSSL